MLLQPSRTDAQLLTEQRSMRLDMVQMLLNAGAIGDPFGQHGFKNAIKLARENRHTVVVDLLEQHERMQAHEAMA